MSHEANTDTDREFEQRTRSLLLESADGLPGALRSRLTQARYAALEARRAAAPASTRSWMGAGAAATAVLVALLVFVPHHGGAPVRLQQPHDEREKQVRSLLGAEGRKIVFDAVLLASAKGRVGEYDIDAFALAP